MPKFKAQNGVFYNLQELEKLNGSAGTVSGTGVTAVQGAGVVQTITLNLAATPVAMVDATTAGSQGNLKIFSFPAGNLTILGATTELDIARVGTALTATAAVVGAIGTVAASAADATLTSTEANIVPSTVATLAAGIGQFDGQSTGVVALDGTATPVDVYLNFAVPDAGSTGNDSLTVTGRVVISYTISGDN
jgi:hypothetical protein